MIHFGMKFVCEFCFVCMKVTNQSRVENPIIYDPVWN